MLVFPTPEVPAVTNLHYVISTFDFCLFVFEISWPNYYLIVLTKVVKTSFTLISFLADASKNLIPCFSAKAIPSYMETFRSLSASDFIPTRIIETLSSANLCISSSQLSRFTKDYLLVMS